MIKKRLFSLVFLLVNTLLFAQNAEHPHAIGIAYIANDFDAPVTKGGWFNFLDNHKTSGAEVSYTWYASPLFNVRVPVSYSEVRYPQGLIENGIPRRGFRTSNALSIDAQLVYKMNNGHIFPKSKICEPYLYAGLAALGAMYDLNLKSSNSSFYSPWGLGVKLHFSPEFSWNTEAGYRINITGTPQHNFLLKMGVAYSFGKPSAKTLEPVLTDATNDLKTGAKNDAKNATDSTKNERKADIKNETKDEIKSNIKSNITTSTDPASYTTWASNKATGVDAILAADAAKQMKKVQVILPDTAKIVPFFAGTIQEEKAAPTEPDKDGDGTPDSIDKCPSFKGAKEDMGCPRGLFDDSDGDGIEDSQDKCPNRKGSYFNFGCPQREDVTFIEQDIRFLPGQKVIEEVSFPILNKILGLLNENEAHKIVISGHTDNIGEGVTNLELSKQRAIACAEYLKSKGIDENRITAAGFGESQPIGSNLTEEGRAKNRRVEFMFYTGNKR